MNNLNQSCETIQNEWRILQNQWQITYEYWKDSIGANFDREYWYGFEQTTQATLREIESLSEVIDKAYCDIPHC